MMFIAFFALIAIAFLFFFVPLFRTPTQDRAISQQGVNTVLFRDRLKEIEGDRQRGKLSDAEFDQLKSELEFGFLADAQASAGDGVTVSASRFPVGAVVMVVILLPVMSLGAYFFEGQWKSVHAWQQTRQQWEPLIEASLRGDEIPEEAAKDLTAADYIRVVQYLLQRDSKNPVAWQDLGRAYMQVGLFSHAEAALQHALLLEPANINLLVPIIEARMAQGKASLDEQSMALLRQAVAAEPHNQKARMILGMALFTGAEYAEAIEVWEALLKDTPPESEGVRILQASIDRARAKLDASDVEGAVAAVDDASAPVLDVNVQVGANVKVPLDGSWTLFVYAKAPQGMPMPVAIKRMPYTDASVQVRLTDADSLMPAAKLSTTQQVEVYARLSKSGQAEPQPGDYMARSAALAVAAGANQTALEITEAVD
ncbi:Cytochrome c-type biogenesis protein [gamma proteobacterium HdN1]|nr:Cytochrome c-type biogenesis protein [gamma proteobacterium HdN1]